MADQPQLLVPQWLYDIIIEEWGEEGAKRWNVVVPEAWDANEGNDDNDDE